MRVAPEMEVDEILAGRMRKGALAAAGLLTVLGTAALLGWALHMPALTHLGDSEPSMRPNAALALALIGLGLLVARRGLWGGHLAATLGGVVAGIGLLTVCENVWGVSLIDHILFSRQDATLGRMSALGGLCFLLAGVALGAGERHRLRRVLAGLIVLVIVPILSEHALGVFLVAWAFPSSTAISLPVAVALLTAASAYLLLYPEGGVAAIAASDTAGGYMARRLVPAGILSPLVVAPFAHLGQAAGLYGSGVRVAMILAASCVATTGVILLAARALHAIDGERQRSAEQARAADRRKDEFLAMLGHELRNPLAPIATAIELARMRGFNECAREWQVVDRHVKHLTRLVDDLMDVSRITRGKVELRRRPVEIARVVARAVEMVSPLLEQRLNRLSLQVAPTGLPVEVDEQRLAQAVANLLTNAAKYTERGGRIEVVASREDGDVVVLQVRDDGVGMEPSLVDRLFQPFVQSARAIDRSEGGLGLGLSIVRSLVEMHGGEVTARSDGPGQGSEFTIRLPAVAGGVLAPRLAAVLPGCDAGGVAGTRILVVDDNRDAAELLAETLRTLGHEVCAAFDGPGALEALADFRPDVGLLDIGLPVMDGYELARRLRKALGADVMLVAVTGYGQEGDRERSLQAGFDAHMVKPVELEALRRIVDEARGEAPPRRVARLGSQSGTINLTPPR